MIGTMRSPGRLPKTLAFLIESSFTFRCRFSVLLCPCLRSKLLSTQSFRENRPFVTIPCFLMPHRRCEKYHSQHRHIRQPAAGVPNGEPAKPLRACISSVRMSQMQPGVGILFREAALSAQCCWRWRAICCLALRRLPPLDLHSSVLHACLTSINRSHQVTRNLRRCTPPAGPIADGGAAGGCSRQRAPALCDCCLPQRCQDQCSRCSPAPGAARHQAQRRR